MFPEQGLAIGLHFVKHNIYNLCTCLYTSTVKTISVREMKAHWAEVEAQVQAGETFEVLNRGRPSVRIIASTPRRILAWDDHLATAIPSAGRSAESTVNADREGRW